MEKEQIEFVRDRVPYGIYQQAVANQEAAKADKAGIEAVNILLSKDNAKLEKRIKELHYQVESQREQFALEYKALQQEIKDG